MKNPINKKPFFTFALVLSLGLLVYTILNAFTKSGPERKTDAKKNNDTFILGVNGHPLNRPDYLSVPVSKQVQYMKDLGFIYYRIDASCNDSGKIIHESTFFELARACSQANIKLLPMITAERFINYHDTLSAINGAKKLTSQFAKNYGKYFDHYELGNELDIRILNDIKNRKSPGTLASDYGNGSEIQIIAAYLKGMNAGIKEQDPNAKTIIDMSETHYGFISLLKNLNVSFDIIGSHFYPNKSYDQSPDFKSLMTNLAKIYNFSKPIWITELNHFLGSANYGIHFNREDDQAAILNNYIANCRKIRNVKALFIYELLDEPTLKVPRANGYERNFGIIKRDSDTKLPVYKSVGRSLKSNMHRF
ncbi:MAG: glycosyl hydrolase 53 family protein [Mucilaginibacter sp.]